VITPAWAWHDHGNEGDGPVAWLDGLDIPMLGFFEAVFMEGYNDQRHEITRPEGDSMARFGNGLLPIDARSPFGPASPIFNYPYARTRAALLAAAGGAGPDPHEATTLRYVNPIDGGWAMPTLATWITYLQDGEKTAAMRSTDSMVMHVVEGSGSLIIGDHTFRFTAKDTIAVPGWTWRSLEADADCVIFVFSDRVVHEKLGFWREERRPA
jgi:gentisate 1,2-dioxygenase